MTPDTIVVDSNALIYSIKYKTDISRQLSNIGFNRIIVPECVMVELAGLSDRVTEARAALAIASKFEKMSVSGKCDSAIVNLAQNMNCAILTNDKEIIVDAKGKLLKVYSLKRKSIIGSV